jgi:hypothetical protein
VDYDVVGRDFMAYGTTNVTRPEKTSGRLNNWEPCSGACESELAGQLAES